MIDPIIAVERSPATEMDPVSTSATSARISIHAMRHPKCRVCRSEWVDAVDTMAVHGFGYRAIHAALPHAEVDGDGAISLGGVRHHIQNHLTPERRALVQQIADEAKSRGVDVTEHTGQLASPNALIDRVISDSLSHLTSGRVSPSVRDALAAVKLRVALDSASTSATDVDTWTGLIGAMVMAAQEVMPPNIYQQWYRKIEASPEFHQAMALRVRTREITAGP